MIELIFTHPFLVGFGLFALLWILFGIYTLQPQESALLSRFGKPVGAKNDPGALRRRWLRPRARR